MTGRIQGRHLLCRHRPVGDKELVTLVFTHASAPFWNAQRGVRKRTHINKALHAVGLKKVDERLGGMGGMADGEDKGHSLTTPLQSG